MSGQPSPELDASVRKVVGWGLGIIFLAVCVSIGLVIVSATLHFLTA